MSENRRTDPVLGTLARRRCRHHSAGVEWFTQAWLTPKHRVAVVFDQWYPDAGNVPEQWRRVRRTYEMIRGREHELRQHAAARLVNGPAAPAGRDAGSVARAMVLVRVVLFGDGSAHAVYDAPPPFHEREVYGTVQPDESFGSVYQFRREAQP